MPSFVDAYRTAHVIESLENYAVADELSLTAQSRVTVNTVVEDRFFEDNGFWNQVFHNPSQQWDKRIIINKCAVSTWVARVPGLYWHSQSSSLRTLAQEEIELESDQWRTYTPNGKSMQVSGGVGTLRFPPDASGKHLITLTCGFNASAGIPALVGDDVWQKLGGSAGADGRLIESVAGRWRQMDTQWAQRFAAIRGIPRGYLVIDSADDVVVRDSTAPVQFHPFSIMEYEGGNSILFDFVYATADTSVGDWRGKISVFFEDYRTRNNRFGRYLTSADIAESMWDAIYVSPAELRRSDGSNRSHLDLLTARVQERLRGGDLIEYTLQALGTVCDNKNELGVLSDELEVPRNRWRMDGSLSDSMAAFVAAVKDRPGKLEELVGLMVARYPTISRD